MMSDSLLEARLRSRSVFVLHFIFLARAIGVWLAHRGSPSEDYAALHWTVRFIPLNPDTTWGIICTTASVLGIVGWWHQRRALYLYFLVFSAWVLLAVSSSMIWTERYAPALLYSALALCVLCEVILAPRGRQHDSSVTLAARAGRAD